jgi:hypothetical protein
LANNHMLRNFPMIGVPRSGSPFAPGRAARALLSFGEALI